MQFLRNLIWSLRTTASETCSFTWTLFLIIYCFVCQFSLYYYWHCYNQKQSSGGALWKRCSNKFRKFHKKTPALRRVFNEVADLQFNFIKKEIPAQTFFCEFWVFLIKPFLKNPLDGCFCRNTRSVYFPSTTFYLFKNNVAHFFGLICRLGTRVRSIF